MPRRVRDREYWDNFGTPSKHLSAKKWRAVAERLRLSDRQLLVIKGLVDGISETTIGGLCGDLSPGTIHAEILRLYAKFNVNDRTSLIVRIFLTHLACEKRGNHSAAPAGK